MVVGIVLALAALMLKMVEWPGGLAVFVLAAAAIGLGLFGLGLHGHRDRDPSDEEPAPPVLRIYRSARCQIERPLIEKLVKAENNLDQRLKEAEAEGGGQEYQEFRERAEKALKLDDLAGAFREHCRAMHVLLKSYNRQRQKVEVFQPLWDRHVPD
jgi:hypothetical protein